MTSPDDPRNDEHTDASQGVVRSVLWRLRARLVTPPEADRARDDLDRILAAAKDHAHEPPGGELAEFRDRVTPAAASAGGAGVDEAPDADASGDEAPTPIRPLKLAPTTAAIEGNRGVRISQHVSRVAAVAVLVVGVGGGLAAAVDRDGTFLALFATGASNSEAPVDPMAATPSESLELDSDALASDDADGDDAPEPDDAADIDTLPPSDEGDGNDVEVADDTDGDATDTSDGSTGSDGGAAESRDAPSSDRGNGNGSGSSTDPAPDPPADEPDDEPADDTGDTGDDSVIALPEDPVDAGDLDGFGGSRDCPEGDLRSCLPGADDGTDDAVSEADEPADGGSVDDGADDTDEGSEEQEPKDPLEELAQRRFGG